jgi:phage baseplate assembly protein W
MAYRQTQINPLDLKPSTGIGVSIPFSTKSVFNTVFTTAEQLKYNIINFLLTGKRERIFVPEFGAGLANQVFEVITEEGNKGLEQYIKMTVENFFTNVEIKRIIVASTFDNNAINVEFTYNIKNTGQSDEILLNFQNG